MAETVNVDVLVVGTGPAGSAAALSLARNGIRALVINKFGWTARTPRAHITNPRTMEVLHDLGVYDEALKHAVPNHLMGENTYCTSLSGIEIGRIRTWGNCPDRDHNYAISSPEKTCDITQNLLEPVLLGSAAHSGAQVLFHTELIDYTQDDGGVTAKLRNNVTGEETTVRCQYLIGADGANSRVADIADLPLEGVHGKEGSMNIVFDADLSKFVEHRPSVLYWIIQDGSDVGGLGMGVVRMVRPWNRWLAIWGYDLAAGQPEVDEEKAISVVHKLIGDDTVPVSIDSISFWTVNDVYATRLSNGRVFCMGDAVHRHPPTKGLGSNTSIQDAFNLSWKLALVLKGQADASLLDSYSVERAPVAKQIVNGANRSISTFYGIMGALGLDKAEGPDGMRDALLSIGDDTPEGEAKRAALDAAVYNTRDVYDNPGIELQHRYTSDAIYAAGDVDPGYAGDPEVFVEQTTYPGARLPHAWVTVNGQRTSILYLCGGAQFTLLTGISGGGWIEAAAAIKQTLGVDINVVQIGALRKVQDVYGEWSRVREIEESGALLVRPDQHIAWRAKSWTADSIADLKEVMQSILGFKNGDESVGAAQEKEPVKA
ncbi:FAD-dependent oxidoreductase [Alterisphingorhabdus coralli]|uniref:FAD-dependent monooxygenase n=1 Tax=Alterisphingorhabdus coralli TaxID=3071408 RepID=A0AA97F8Q1_9SPHN|nr:FAD-dependent monooxygenase [Parasphingorhabdus sp. SCSIO 66989]WOE75353.1 FAD-dependent monooxygenase [Parasphingorhabdus sp. SCSIO 66989]